MPQKIILLGLVVGLLPLRSSTASGQGTQPLVRKQLDQLKSEERPVREKAAAELLRVQKDLVRTLLLELADRQDPRPGYRDRKELVIELLGDLRAIEAVPYLIKHLTYRVPYKRLEINPIQAYPCARALIRIGTPAYPEIWSRLREPVNNELETRLVAYIVRQIAGHEIGLVRLEAARRDADNINTVDGGTQRKNLDDLIKHYKTKATGF